MAENEDMARLRAAINQLGEHFDTVQIFTTRHEMGSDDGTVSCVLGIGNWYARCGVIREWLIKRDEDTRESIRKPDND